MNFGTSCHDDWLPVSPSCCCLYAEIQVAMYLAQTSCQSAVKLVVWRRASTHLHILIYAIYMYNIHIIKSHSAIFCSRVSCLKHLQIPALSSRSKRFKSLELKWSEHASPMASPYASCRHLATPPSGLAFWSQPWFRWTIHRLFGKFGEKSEQASRTQIRLKKPG